MIKIILLIAIFLLCSCASKPIQLVVDIPMPAEINISGYPTVAVIPINGQISKNATTKINSNIVSSKLSKVIDDLNSKELIEQNLKMSSDAYSAESISNLGKMIKADAIIFVESNEFFDDEQVTEVQLEPDFSDDPYQSQITGFNQKTTMLNINYQNQVNQLNNLLISGHDPAQINIAKANLDQEYKNQYSVYELELQELQKKQADYKQKKIDDKRIQYTRTGNLVVDMSITFTNAKTGEVIVSKQYNEKKTLETKAVNREPSRINPLPNYNPIMDKIVNSFTKAIIPYNSTSYIWVEVVDHPDFERGTAFFRNQSWNESIIIFQGIYNNFNSNPELQANTEELAKAYYNYGLALSLSLNIDNIEKSLEVLKKAYFISPKSFYNDILNFAKNRKEQLLKLKTQIGEKVN